MKVVIFCGGLGTRLAAETKIRPKAMVSIGNKPIIWHLINYYKVFGFREFYLTLGYKGNYIKKYFKKYPIKNCKIHLINTGKNSMTGGRLLRLENFLNKEENFLATYGDGLSNVNLNSLIRFHLNKKKIATLTSVRPPVRFGEVKFNDSKIVTEFKEKQQSSQNWINGGFFIFSREIFKYIKDDMTVLEKKPFEKLVKIKQLATYTHRGFWQCMDTMREKIFLNNLWIKKKAPWKNWKK